jgi:hypothetical protein
MPIAGYTRFRKHQLGKQTVIGTPVAATRVFPFRGAIVHDPHWTEPDVDVGSIDPVMAPYKMASDTTSSQSGPLCYDDISRILSASVIGGTSPTGGPAYTHTFTAASLTATNLDHYTDEWGDDDTTDWVQAYGGIISRLQWGFGEALGPWDVTMDWLYAGRNTVTPTAGLAVSSNPIWVYGRDTGIYINSTGGTIGTTRIADAIHSLQQTITLTVDNKRFANGSNDGFATVAWGIARREIVTDITFAKSSTVVAETAKWLADDPVDRYLEVRSTSPTMVTGSTPYSNSIKLAGNWFTRTDGEQGNNSTVTLSLHSRYDAGLAYVFKDVCINSRSAV